MNSKIRIPNLSYNGDALPHPEHMVIPFFRGEIETNNLPFLSNQQVL